MTEIYVRMVLRVHPDLPGTIQLLSEKLFDETRIEFSYAAIARGLISIGLAQITGAYRIAPFFYDSIVKRGRKPGKPRSVVLGTVSLDGEDLDLEDDDKFNDGLVAKRVVARDRVRRRRSSSLYRNLHKDEADLVRARTSEEDDLDEEEEQEEDGDEGEDEDEPDTEREGKPS